MLLITSSILSVFALAHSQIAIVPEPEPFLESLHQGTLVLNWAGCCGCIIVVVAVLNRKMAHNSLFFFFFRRETLAKEFKSENRYVSDQMKRHLCFKSCLLQSYNGKEKKKSVKEILLRLKR